MQRGQIYLLKPDAEGKQRPVVIVSRDELNGGHSVVAIPFYSQQLERRAKLRYCALFNVGDGGLDKACVAKADEISLIAKSEIDVKRGHIGRMKPEQMTRIIESVRHMLRDDSLPAASPSARS